MMMSALAHLHEKDSTAKMIHDLLKSLRAPPLYRHVIFSAG